MGLIQNQKRLLPLLLDLPEVFLQPPNQHRLGLSIHYLEAEKESDLLQQLARSQSRMANDRSRYAMRDLLEQYLDGRCLSKARLPGQNEKGFSFLEHVLEMRERLLQIVTLKGRARWRRIEEWFVF